MNIEITNSPSDINEWNALCLLNNNLLQTTYYDDVKMMFGQYPVYFACYENQKLIGGVRAFIYKSKKLPVFKNISSSLTILGEFITNTSNHQLGLLLNQAIEEYIRTNHIVRVRSSGYYGDTNLLPLYQTSLQKNIHRFNVSAFDLTLAQDTLWKNTKESHRRNINKAIKSNVEFVEDNDIDRFIYLLNETYAHQAKQAPNSAFIKKLFDCLNDKGFIKIYFSKNKEQYIASSFVIEYGQYAEYAFGGNLKNNVGAGHFLHWNIALLYKQKNFQRYILGQVAAEGTHYENNKKFEQGITRFKKDFATFELPSATIEITTNNLKYTVWKTINRLAGI